MSKVLKWRLMSDKTSNYRQIENDLKRWGACMRPLMYGKNAYYNRQAQCVLSKLVRYGINTPSGYYSEDNIDDPRVILFNRLFHFMPREEMRVVTVHRFIIDGDDRVKARRLGMSLHSYQQWLSKVLDFYLQYQNVDFS